MWPRKTLDIGFSHLLCGLSYAIFSRSRNEDRTAQSNGRLVCLSVRSGFDTLLRSLNLPVGSEVLFSELTIPDMARLTKANDLVPVGVPLDPETWFIDIKSLEDSITSRTRAIVVAHLFGRRRCLNDIAAIARRHNLLLIEDCAQAFQSPDEPGDPSAGVSMFSFGPIKTNTCLAGGILQIRSDNVAEGFANEHDQLTRQRNRTFARRLAKCLVLKCFEHRFLYGMLYRVLSLAGCDPDAFISGLARGFPGEDFLRRIRRRPSMALERLMEKRLEQFDPQRIRQRCVLGRQLTSLLSPSIVTPAHSGCPSDGYWVYPVLSRYPESLKVELVRNGFDGTQRSSFTVIRGLSGERTPGADFLEQVVFLPLEVGMSQSDICRLAEIVNSHEIRWQEEGVSRRKLEQLATDASTVSRQTSSP